MKRSTLFLTLTASALLYGACANEQTPTTTDPVPEKEKSLFESLCEQSGGAYKNENKCSCNNIICDDGVVCNVTTRDCPAANIPDMCGNDQTFCSNSKFYTCHDHEWQETKDGNIKNQCIKNGCLPDNSACAECTGNYCTAGTFVTCKNGLIDKEEACKSNICQDATKCQALCAEGERTCKDNQLYICKNGELSKEKDCPAGCDTTTNNSCAKGCTNGDTICQDGTIKTCNNDVYGDPVPCDNGVSCKDDKTCGECLNETTKCVNEEQADFDNVGFLYQCKNGLFDTDNKTICKDTYGNMNSCNSNSTGCGECLNETTKCVNEQDYFDDVGFLYQCKNGLLDIKTKTRCMDTFGNRSSCNSDRTECGECLNGLDFCLLIGTSTNLYECIDGQHGEFRKICSWGCSITKTCGQKP